jgi:hypothetical protein
MRLPRQYSSPSWQPWNRLGLEASLRADCHFVNWEIKDQASGMKPALYDYMDIEPTSVCYSRGVQISSDYNCMMKDKLHPVCPKVLACWRSIL